MSASPDKIPASKRKGMWMGGMVPLGYDVCNRRLAINAAEAQLVRQIYQRYLELGSVRADQIEKEGCRGLWSSRLAFVLSLARAAKNHKVRDCTPMMIQAAAWGRIQLMLTACGSVDHTMPVAHIESAAGLMRSSPPGIGE